MLGQSRPNFMALLTVSTESALTEAGNSVLTASVFHRYATHFGFRVCILNVTMHSALTRLSQKFWRLHVSGESSIVSAECSGKQSHEIGPCRVSWENKLKNHAQFSTGNHIVLNILTMVVPTEISWCILFLIADSVFFNMTSY